MPQSFRDPGMGHGIGLAARQGPPWQPGKLHPLSTGSRRPSHSQMEGYLGLLRRAGPTLQDNLCLHGRTGFHPDCDWQVWLGLETCLVGQKPDFTVGHPCPAAKEQRFSLLPWVAETPYTTRERTLLKMLGMFHPHPASLKDLHLAHKTETRHSQQSWSS